MNDYNASEEQAHTMTLDPEALGCARDASWPEEPVVDQIGGATVGKVIGFTLEGLPLVQFAANHGEPSLPARHVCPLRPADVGREALLVFEEGDYQKPIIVGLLHTAGAAEARNTSVNVSVDGQQITLSAQNEIVLRCGKASITLTRAGKVLIRGAYLLSRSSGVNRVKGGSVQIN